MPKQKTRKAAAKRCKITGAGRIKRTSAGGAHLLTGKSRKHKRSLRSSQMVCKADQKRIMECLHQ